MHNCLICNGTIGCNVLCYGLVYGNKILLVKQNNNGVFSTPNGVKYTVIKQNWLKNPNKCFGPVVHIKCYNLLSKKLNLKLKFDDVAYYISDDKNILKNTNYGANTKSNKNYSVKANANYNEKLILTLWINFKPYQKSTQYRQKYVDNILKSRLLNMSKLQQKKYNISSSQ